MHYSVTTRCMENNGIYKKEVVLYGIKLKVVYRFRNAMVSILWLAQLNK